MSRRAAARRYEISESVAIKWLERVERDGSREPVGHGGQRLQADATPGLSEAVRAEKSDVTLQALCDRLSAERGVKADTSMVSRFFRRISVTVSARHTSRENSRGAPYAAITLAALLRLGQLATRDLAACHPAA
jgi:transposase